MRYHRQLDEVRAHVVSLRLVIGVLTLLCVGLWIGWDRAPQQLTLHYPPDLREGAELAVNEIPPTSVYAFGHYLFHSMFKFFLLDILEFFNIYIFQRLKSMARDGCARIDNNPMFVTH